MIILQLALLSGPPALLQINFTSLDWNPQNIIMMHQVLGVSVLKLDHKYSQLNSQTKYWLFNKFVMFESFIALSLAFASRLYSLPPPN